MVGLVYGFTTPKYQSLGTDLAGEVVAIGENVTEFTVGQRVVANLGMSLGGHAEFKVLSTKAAIANIPDSVSYDDAVALVF